MSIHTDPAREDTFLARYLSYCAESETPHAYDLMCGLFLLSCAVGRRLRVERPRAPVYLNMYTMLVAEAGTTRKSTAVRRVEEVYHAAGFDRDGATITASITPEGLTQQLGAATDATGSANACLMVSELVTVLGRESYAAGMPGLLTDLYDCPSSREVRRAKAAPVTVKNVHVNVLAASTPSWLVRAINPDVIEGGFTSRCLFVCEEQRKRRIAWPVATGSEREQLRMLVADLHHVRHSAERWSSRGIGLHETAIRHFVQWYEHRQSGRDDAYTTSFEAREDHHVLKLAALFACNDGSFVVGRGHLTSAQRLIAYHKRKAAVLFGSGAEVQRLVAGIDALRRTLHEGGEQGISQTDLFYKMRKHIRAQEQEYIMGIMHELGMVQRFEVATSGRRRTVWRGTEKLQVRDIHQLLVDRITQT